MSLTLELELMKLEDRSYDSILTEIIRGIEKESLRVSLDGHLSQSSHPLALGSALTHSSITTDYSEALLELITPPSRNIDECLDTLSDIHNFVYQNIKDEMLWSTSMPCIVAGRENIPIAQYGASNVAKMKTIYRRGLGFRYGRTMQAIAGIHYNFSLPQKFWEMQWEQSEKKENLQDYISKRYLGLIRNFQRYSWLLIYLFGASPAVCSSFLDGIEHHSLEPFDTKKRSFYRPFATALRMGSLGYNSSAQQNMNVSYNSLNRYIDTLKQSITTPYSDYHKWSAGENGEYQQLNRSLLQIENEFYSSIRPKRVTYSGETPSAALRRGGIEYIEVRCIDVNPFLPIGIDKNQSLFLDAFLLYCLLLDSPPIDSKEQIQINANFESIVNDGRNPRLQLANRSGPAQFQELAKNLLEDIKLLSSHMSRVTEDSGFITSFQEQLAKVEDASLTPSARMLKEMQENDLTFFELGLSYSRNWASMFSKRVLSDKTRDHFAKEAKLSIETQKEIEESDKISFPQYLKDYYGQYDDS